MSFKNRGIYTEARLLFTAIHSNLIILRATHYSQELAAVNSAERRPRVAVKQRFGVRDQSVISDRLQLNELNNSPFFKSYTRLIYPILMEIMNRRWLYVNQDNLRGVQFLWAYNRDVQLERLSTRPLAVYRGETRGDGIDGIIKDTFSFPTSCCCCYRESIRP